MKLPKLFKKPLNFQTSSFGFKFIDHKTKKLINFEYRIKFCKKIISPELLIARQGVRNLVNFSLIAVIFLRLSRISVNNFLLNDNKTLTKAACICY